MEIPWKLSHHCAQVKSVAYTNLIWLLFVTQEPAAKKQTCQWKLFLHQQQPSKHPLELMFIYGVRRELVIIK